MFKALSLSLALLVLGLPVFSQSGLALQGAQHDNTLPIDVTADTLTVDDATQTAIFSGEARAVQGDISIDAEMLKVTYSEETGEITSVLAEGNVRYSNGTETATAEKAEFTNETNILFLEGGVELIQGQTLISANQMRLNVSTNAAELTGNVRSRFVPRNE